MKVTFKGLSNNKEYCKKIKYHSSFQRIGSLSRSLSSKRFVWLVTEFIEKDAVTNPLGLYFLELNFSKQPNLKGCSFSFLTR